MRESNFAEQRIVADEYGNQHRLASELARGGQGVVFRTTDSDLAIKQPLGADGHVDRDVDAHKVFKNVRRLPLPSGIPISLPLAVLRDEPGYVMSLLSEMEPLAAFDLNGDTKDSLASAKVPAWLAGIKDRNTALTLLHYALSGSTKRRLQVLGQVASILARLHATGLVYGDISPNNCFMGECDSQDVWLIDADNLRFELVDGGASVYTPRYGAPEIVRGLDRSRPRTDAWAFAVMAFETLALVHPFIGKKVLDPEDDEGGWDAEPVADDAPVDLDEQAYAGFMPFVDDETDDSNRAMSGLPRGLILTPQLVGLCQEMFGPGLTKPWRRPSMAFWALELTRAADQSVLCDECAMSYLREHVKCPFCDAPRPSYALLSTDRWKMVVQPREGPVWLPHRLFNAFSLRHHARHEYEAVVDFDAEIVTHVRGSEILPTGLAFEFVKEP